ncbi:hypothetical protein LAZ67_1006832 [Cordylochernes scorpioides]|uniref:Uncharacterized protein n=1 Tax=Cordylochernes scorpioides TaxID=51811 RepID=A0ABY6JYV5_9ARAC|nr:hypothetical protein LAZ67_1006832 [Cordylochernes scorpioides]
MAVFLADGMRWRYKWLVGPPLLVEGYADPHVLTSLWLHRHSYKLPHFLVPTIFSTVGAPWTHQGVYQLRFDVWTNLPLFSPITMSLLLRRYEILYYPGEVLGQLLPNGSLSDTLGRLERDATSLVSLVLAEQPLVMELPLVSPAS